MTATIAGVPEKVARADYLALVESLGLEFDDLIELKFHVSSIEAKVLARNPAGDLYTAGDDVATHSISIPVED